MRLSLAALLLIVSATAHAVPVTWTFQNVVFEDGGTLAGSFTYDADTVSYSDVNVTTTAGSAAPGATYLFQDAFFPLFGPDNTWFSPVNGGDATGEYSVHLSFLEDLTNAGGTIALNSSFEGICTASNCINGDILRYVTSGSVTAVPVPAAVWLMLSGLASLRLLKSKST